MASAPCAVRRDRRWRRGSSGPLTDVGTPAANEREALRVLNGLQREVNIQIGPIEVARMKELDVHKLADGCVLEPGKVFEGQQEFAPLH